MGIRQYIFAWRFRRAVKKANTLSELFHARYYVLSFGGRLRVMPKSVIKVQIRRRMWRKGTTIADIEKRALYITPLGNRHVSDR